MSEAVVEVERVTKYFDTQRVLHDVDLKIFPGEICGLLGRNGTGKTTLIKILLGLEPATTGATRVFGRDSRRLTPAVKRRIGYVAEGHALPGYLSVEALIKLTRGVVRRFDMTYLRHLLDRLALPTDRKVRRLSRGQRAQLALALALATQPELLILDDPTLGLDTVVRREFLELAIDLIQQEGRTILITSHILSDVERLADHIGILHDQRIVVDCSLEHLKSAVRKLRLVWTERAPDSLPVRGIVRSRRSQREWLITLAEPDDAKMAMLQSAGPERIEPVPMGLEEIFVEYAGNHENGSAEVAHVATAAS